MKKNIYFITFVVLIICSYLNKSVQAQEISHVEILPEYATSADEILFVVSTTFPFIDCRLDSIHPFFACGAFAYDAFYGSSFDTGACESTDTIKLGTLPNGFYPITYRMYYLGWSQVDQVDTTIIVGVVGMDEFSQNTTDMKIWPNPSRGQVNIATNDDLDRIVISTTSGVTVKTLDIQQGVHQFKLTLPAGLYICTPIRNGKPISAKRMVVLDN
jgi:hypothetical protein